MAQRFAVWGLIVAYLLMVMFIYSDLERIRGCFYVPWSRISLADNLSEAESVTLWDCIGKMKRSSAWNYGAQEQWEGQCEWGTMQSPIDLVMNDAKRVEGGAPYFPNKDLDGWLYYDERSLEAVLDPAYNNRVILSGVFTSKTELKAIHVHRPSEHTLDGQRFDMEYHFVHMNERGRLDVLAILFEVGEQRSTWLTRFLGDSVVNEQSGRHFGLRDVYSFIIALREKSMFFRYNGSLTTPPCLEGVHMYVLANPLHCSQAQLERLATKFPTNRKLQRRNGRPIELLLH